MTDEGILLLGGFFAAPLFLGIATLLWGPTRRCAPAQFLLWLAVGCAGLGVLGLFGARNARVFTERATIVMGAGTLAWGCLVALLVVSLRRPGPTKTERERPE
jgi:hypothetical protein